MLEDTLKGRSQKYATVAAVFFALLGTTKAVRVAAMADQVFGSGADAAAMFVLGLEFCTLIGLLGFCAFSFLKQRGKPLLICAGFYAIDPLCRVAYMVFFGFHHGFEVGIWIDIAFALIRLMMAACLCVAVYMLNKETHYRHIKVVKKLAMVPAIAYGIMWVPDGMLVLQYLLYRLFPGSAATPEELAMMDEIGVLLGESWMTLLEGLLFTLAFLFLGLWLKTEASRIIHAAPYGGYQPKGRMLGQKR